jgi:lipopolysaccharide biosynthesis glycosyltransferase
MDKNRAVLVTLADENYIDQAKQLFSSVYWNSGWKGDYLLLARKIPEDKLKWFIDKGIIVRRINPVVNEPLNYLWPPIIYDKFQLFSNYFKRWNVVVYLDADIIVRGSLDSLLKEKGISAVSSIFDYKLRDNLWRIHNPSDRKLMKQDDINEYYSKLSELRKKYDFNDKAFNSGLIVFNTSIIRDDTFFNLKKLLDRYGFIIKADDGILSLFFYKKWKSLSVAYNVNANFFKSYLNISGKDINGIVIHFIHNIKPWEKESDCYEEWKHNLRFSDGINLIDRPIASFKWNYYDFLKLKIVILYGIVRNFHRVMFRLYHKILGLVGIFLNRRYPKMCNFLKKGN